MRYRITRAPSRFAPLLDVETFDNLFDAIEEWADQAHAVYQWGNGYAAINDTLDDDPLPALTYFANHGEPIYSGALVDDVATLGLTPEDVVEALINVPAA